MKKITISWLPVVVLLLPLVSLPSQAGDNDLLMSLYPEGGQSLFCGTKFSQLNNRIRSTALYPLNVVRHELGCRTDTQCQSNGRYRLISADLQNLFPIQSRVDLKRRNTVPGEISSGDVARPAGKGCSLHLSFQIMEPDDHLKGDIARVYLYMADTYDLPLQDSIDILNTWHLTDPPDKGEQARNNRIEVLQGTRNRFIDNPQQTL